MEGKGVKIYVGNQLVGASHPITLTPGDDSLTHHFKGRTRRITLKPSEWITAFTDWEYYMRRSGWSYFRCEYGRLRIKHPAIPEMKYGDFVGITFDYE